MTEWRECKLGDIVVFNYGKALPENKRIAGNIPVYSSAGLTGYHNESIVSEKGIIIGRKGTIGKVYYSNSPFYCIDTAFFIKESKSYCLKYIYYLLQTLGLDELNEDSAVPGLNRNTAYQQDISLPDGECKFPYLYIGQQTIICLRFGRKKWENGVEPYRQYRGRQRMLRLR